MTKPDMVLTALNVITALLSIALGFMFIAAIIVIGILYIPIGQ